MPTEASYLAARKKHHTALMVGNKGEIKLNGQDYEVVLKIGRTTLENAEGGQRVGELLTVRLLKTQIINGVETILETPDVNALIICKGFTWRIESVEGREPWAAEWVIMAVR